MNKGTKSIGAVAILASDDPAFSQASKHADGVGGAANAPYSVGEAGMACGDAFAVISISDDACCAEKKMLDSQFRHDLEVLTAMQLRAKYQGEATSHRNMLSRVKLKGAVVHESFRRFSDFLHHVGPKPTKSATLDRIDNTDPEYAPGKVRWADKQTQNRNKGDSLVFTCPTSGRSYTASQLAKIQGLTPAGVRSRRARGWTDTEIIHGRRSLQSSGQTAFGCMRSDDPCPFSEGSGARVMWFRIKASVEAERDELGEEPFIMTPAEFQRIMQDDHPEMRGADYLAWAEDRFLKFKLPRYWKEYGPHINFAALRPDQQAWVLRIDPAQGQKTELSDRL